jgi:hypothetical protein
MLVQRWQQGGDVQSAGIDMVGGERHFSEWEEIFHYHLAVRLEGGWTVILSPEADV